MGRAGIEPATHGFSGHGSSRSNLNGDGDLTKLTPNGAALALQSTPELRELIDLWPSLSKAERTAILAKARALRGSS